MNWRNCITLTKLHHPMWRNCIPGDLISSVRTFWFQHSTNYKFFNLKCISAQQIKENTINFQMHSYVRMKYTACFADIHRMRRYDEITSPYVSETAIGCELLQVVDGKECVISYGSFSLTPAQRKYCTTHKELLAVVRFTHQFHHYLLGHRFVCRTDHNSLTWLMSFKNIEGQLAR